MGVSSKPVLISTLTPTGAPGADTICSPSRRQALSPKRTWPIFTTSPRSITRDCHRARGTMPRPYTSSSASAYRVNTKGGSSGKNLMRRNRRGCSGKLISTTGSMFNLTLDRRMSSGRYSTPSSSLTRLRSLLAESSNCSKAKLR